MIIISFLISGVAAWIMISSGRAKKPLLKKTPAILLSIFIHVFSSCLLFAFVQIGEAWSGYSSSHSLPDDFLLSGLAILFIIFFGAHSTVKDDIDTQQNSEKETDIK